MQYRNLRIRTTLDEACDPEHMALLVYDAQVGVLSQIPDAGPVLERLRGLLAGARAAGVRVFFTRHVSLPLAVTGTAGLRTAMVWQRTSDPAALVEAFPPDAPGTQLAPELGRRPDEAVFDKIGMSAFVGTPLETALRDAGIEALAVAGVALEVGIEPTIRHGLDLGFLPVLVTDACGSGDAAAAERSLAQLAWFGGTLRAEARTVTDLWAAATR